MKNMETVMTNSTSVKLGNVPLLFKTNGDIKTVQNSPIYIVKIHLKMMNHVNHVKKL